VLFIDAISAPLGTANVYTAVTGRILYGLGRDFFPESFITRLNKYSAPSLALWLSAVVGMCFLLPFPTWKQLVDFLSSIVAFSYIAGPIGLILLREAMPDEGRVFKVMAYKLIGYLGFVCCSLFIYWSGMQNLSYLVILLLISTIGYGILVRESSVIKAFTQSWYLIAYMLAMTLVSYLRLGDHISFPLDNVFIVVIGFIACRIMLMKSLTKEQITQNVIHAKQEINKDHALYKK
jgi:amino acid transporter